MERVQINTNNKSEAKLFLDIAKKMGLTGKVLPNYENDAITNGSVVNEEQGVYQLSPAQKEAVIKAREQIKAGNSFTDEEVNKEIDEWLGE